MSSDEICGWNFHCVPSGCVFVDAPFCYGIFCNGAFCLGGVETACLLANWWPLHVLFLVWISLRTFCYSVFCRGGVERSSFPQWKTLLGRQASLDRQTAF